MRIALLGAVILIIAVAALSYSGFCCTQGRYLSDEEKINIAVQYFLAAYPPVIEHEVVNPDGSRKQVTAPPPQAVRYRDVDEFFRLNPGCCEVVKEVKTSGGETLSLDFWNRLAGLSSSFVRVKYLVRYQDEQNTVRTHPVEAALAFSNCGHVWSGI
jgi:hypothetical protein